jgi:hypothetical protein
MMMRYIMLFRGSGLEREDLTTHSALLSTIYGTRTWLHWKITTTPFLQERACKKCILERESHYEQIISCQICTIIVFEMQSPHLPTPITSTEIICAQDTGPSLSVFIHNLYLELYSNTITRAKTHLHLHHQNPTWDP